MRADYHVLLDACVLANHGVADLLLRLAERPRLFVPHWSEEILSEVRRTHQEKLGWPLRLVDTFQAEIRNAFPQSLVGQYERLIPFLTNDEKDRHVLAAAIHGDCPLILTFNLKHFPAEALAPHGIRTSHPEEYLVVLYEMAPERVMGTLGEIAGRRKMDIEDVLIRLGTVVPAFSSRLLDTLSK